MSPAFEPGFAGVHGQTVAVETLRRALVHQRIHHAYRFEGPRGVGKELTARLFARALLCKSTEHHGCGDCHICRRAMTDSEQAPHVPLHPDVVLVGKGLYAESLKQKEGTGIGVEQVRRIVLERCRTGPHEGGRLVFIIRAAEELTPASANALLKTLEEPRSHVHFILLTHSPPRLLDTVRSRSVAVRFAPLPQSVLEELLQQRGLPASAAHAAEGSAARAIDYASDDNRGAVERFAHELDQALGAPTLRAALSLAAELPKDREAARELLVAYQRSLAAGARQDASSYEALLCAERYHLVERALFTLSGNTAPQLVLEGFAAEAHRPMQD